MKLFELFQPARPEPEAPAPSGDIDLLLSVLMQDNDGNGVPDIIDKIEKFLKAADETSPHDPSARDFDVEPEIYPAIAEAADNTSRIASIKDLLTQTNDAAMLDRVESLLREAALSGRVDKMFETRGFDNKRMAIYKDSFSDLIQLAQSSVKSKIELLYYFTKNAPSLTKADVSTTYRKNLSEIIPQKIVQNDTFQQIWQKMFFASAFRGKGIGPGEFALAVLGKDGNIVDANGDIMIDGWGVELKDGKAGSLKPGKVVNTHRVADAARDKLAKQLGVTIATGKGNNDKKFAIHTNNEFVRAMKELPMAQQQKLMMDWANTLYPGLPTEARKELVLNIVNDLGTPAAKQHYGEPVLAAYKEKDKWDSIMFVGKDGTIVNVVDPLDAKDFLNFKPSINRGGDTQALPDGYVNASIPKG